MTTLLEIRERIIAIYRQYESTFRMVFRFIITFLAVGFINDRIGYREVLTQTLLVLIVSLLSTLIPPGGVAGILAVLILAHLYSLSLTAAAVGLALFLLLMLVFFRFSPKDTILLLIAPVCFRLGIPYALPVIAGLLFLPTSAVTLAVGYIVIYFVEFISENRATIEAASEDQLGRFRFLADGIMQNRTMMVMILAAVFTTVIIYTIRRLAMKYAWIAALVAGSIVQMIILLVGDMMFGTGISVGKAFLGVLAGALIGLVITFFAFSLDYSRIESTQFEDDEYYYYVKAVPKYLAASPRKRTVKKISTPVQEDRSVRQDYYEDPYADSQEDYLYFEDLDSFTDDEYDSGLPEDDYI